MFGVCERRVLALKLSGGIMIGWVVVILLEWEDMDCAN